MAQGRSILKSVFENFINSLKPNKRWGEMIGKDQFGTEYYEKPTRTRGRPARWFEPVKRGNHEQEIPIEWEAWLRFKRKDPPTQEEIFLNSQRREQTVENARKLETPKAVNKDEIKTFEKPPFPVYSEYEEEPGKGQNTGKQI